MQIEITPETERLVREEISNGHFRSVDDLIQAGVEAWREKHIQLSKNAPDESPSEPFWKTFTRGVHSLPVEIFDLLPEDGASEHDHYLYGAPKKNT